MRKIVKLFQTKPTSIDEENKRVTFAISTNQPDRDGEIVEQKSWNFKDYMENPMFLWGHNPEIPENVLGHCIELKSSEDGSETLGTFQFDTDINERADLVFKQVVRGSLRTVSVGFMTGDEERQGKNWLLKNNTLLETSIAPIPSNPGAIVKDYKAGLISRKDATWLIESARKEADQIEEQMKAHAEDSDKESAMDKVAQKQLAAILSAITKLAEGQSTFTKQLEELSTKGAVSDILNSDQSWEVDDAKWDNMSMVSCVYSALCEAYYYSATPVDQFSVLLKEFIQIVGKIADGSFEKSADGLLGDKIMATDDTRVKQATSLLLESLSQKGSLSPALEDTHTKGGEPTATKDADADADKPEDKPADKPVDPAEDKPADETPTDDVAKDKEETSTAEDPAKGGDNDQPGAGDGDEIDLDGELTPELEEQLEKQLA